MMQCALGCWNRRAAAAKGRKRGGPSAAQHAAAVLVRNCALRREQAKAWRVSKAG